MSFFEELKRRNVLRVALAYLAGAWLLLQVADVLVNNSLLPRWNSSLAKLDKSPEQLARIEFDPKLPGN